MPTTPRRVQGPGLELVGVVGEQGGATALWIPAGSPCATEGLSVPEAARAFLVRPAIAGLARLVAVDRDQNAAPWDAARSSAKIPTPAHVTSTSASYSPSHPSNSRFTLTLPRRSTSSNGLFTLASQ